jgi:hypothetical protein
MVNQVRVVAILMIVQGTLTTLMGILLLLSGPLLWAFRPIFQGSQSLLADEDFLVIASVIYAVMSVPVLIAGVLNLIAGIRSLNLRGRTFAIVALLTNFFPLLTLYCAPTGLGLMVYGLVVFFNEEVARAFENAAAEKKDAEVQDFWPEPRT